MLRSLRRLGICILGCAAMLLSLVSASGGERLSSRPRSAVIEAPRGEVGTAVSTEFGEHRRLSLPDGTILNIDQNTRLKIDAPRQITLSAGTILVEAARAADLVVKTEKRSVQARAARFVVKAANSGTGVIVLQGQARVGGVTVHAGQQLPADGDKPTPAPRSVQQLTWARGLIAASSPSLVPGSEHAGGALVTIDPNGQEAKLSLRKYHIDVHVEDGFARTTIDQTFFNHQHSRLEGTFYFPLPADASLSRLAMYVDGKLMEGGMAERDYARQVYETIRYTQRDPALLEWLDGTTFKMRVFPLEPRQEKRIILSYTQRLPRVLGRTEYRFPAGDRLPPVRDWSFRAFVKRGANLTWSSDSHALKAEKHDGDVTLSATAHDTIPNRDVVLLLDDSIDVAKEQYSTIAHEGSRYFMVRYRPALLSANPQSEIRNPQSKHWVFLFESSGDRSPLLARVQVEVVRGLLDRAEPGDTFSVLAANTRVRSWAPEPRPITPANVQSALAFLEEAHLVGALDLGRALAQATTLLKDKPGMLVHVGTGIAALGERRRDVLAQSIPEGVRYVGVGVGKRWARDFMKAAAERSGGWFTQINPDEPIAWRTFELADTLKAPALLDIRIADDSKRGVFLNFAGSITQGEEVCAVARIPADAPLPERVRITGIVNGKLYVHTLNVRNVADKADYLPRLWAKLEIERLLAEDAKKHKEKVVALSKAMYVMSPYTSLLVLENEDMYVQFKVDRGRKDHWAMYPAPASIPVVYERDLSLPFDPRAGKPGSKPSVEEVLKTVVGRGAASMAPPRVGQIMIAGNVIGSKSVREPLNQSEDLRQIEKDWERIWFTDQPTHFTQGISGGVSPSTANHVSWNIGLQSTVPLGFREATVNSSLMDNLNHYTSSMAVPGATDTPLVTVQPSAFAPALSKIPHINRLFRNQSYQRTRIERLSKLLASGAVDANVVKEEEEEEERRALRRSGATGIDTSDKGITHVYMSADDLSIYLAPQAELYSPLRFARPALASNDSSFFDLVSYCPGMNTSEADMSAVVDVEAASSPATIPGRIDPAAQRLIDGARSAGWRTYTLAADKGKPGIRVTFDGPGRFVAERTLPPGLREQIVCDGITLWHLYPDLGIGARRTVSRFHRFEFALLLPWLLPSADDLARGADVRLVADRVVEIVPHRFARGHVYLQTNLIFNTDGSLAERNVVLMPANRTLGRWLIAADGTIRHLDGKGKEHLLLRGTLAAAAAPSLKPHLAGLVVLPLPYRTRDHVRKALKIEQTQNQNLRFEDARALFAADFASGNNEAANTFTQAFHGREQRQLGFYVLLAAIGQNLDGDHLDVLAEHTDKPLGQYLALFSSPVLRKHASQWAVGTGQWKEGYLYHLASTYALLQRWGSAKGQFRAADYDRALDYVSRHKDTIFAWQLLCLMQDRAGDKAEHRQRIAAAWLLFAEGPGLKYAASYEHARSLWKAGQRDEARKQFIALFSKTLDTGRLPPLDADFRKALLGEDTRKDDWNELMQRSAEKLIAKGHSYKVLLLARQCVQLDDFRLADALLESARKGITEPSKRLLITLAEIEFLIEISRLPEAERLHRELLREPKWAKRAALWRLGALIAEKRGQSVRQMECLERALDLEFARLPEVIDLERVRAEYRLLLNHYQSLAQAMVALKLAPPADFLPRVIRTADRWRGLDEDGDTACSLAAEILRTLGQHEQAWDYLTTPLARQPNEAEPWRALGRQMRSQGEVVLADNALRAAFEAEPTNAEILWDVAENLRDAGRGEEARSVLRRIEQGTWQPRFRSLREQARQALGGG